MVDAYPRFLQSVANLRHRVGSAATDTGARHRINWTGFTVTDDSVNDEVAVSIGPQNLTTTVLYNQVFS